MTFSIGSGITIGEGTFLGDMPAYRTPNTVSVVQQGRVSNTQVKFGTGSYSNNDLNGALSVTPASNFAFGTGDFTVEFWHYPTSLAGYQAYFGTRPSRANGNYPVLVLNNNGLGTVQYYMSNGFKITTTNALTLNTWNSVALVRNGTRTTIYVNGIAGGSWNADTTNYLAASCIFFGDDFYAGVGLPIKGYTDEVRVSNVARYTSNYTPAAQAFVNDPYTLLLLHCDGADGSTVFNDTGF